MAFERHSFGVDSAEEFARRGAVHDWVRDYLTVPEWANPGLLRIVEYQKPIWEGPVEIELSSLTRSCGPEEGMRYRVTREEWEPSISAITQWLTDPRALPPLIVRPTDQGVFVPDGNHRLEAMRRLGWSRCWALVWRDRDPKFANYWRSRPPEDA